MGDYKVECWHDKPLSGMWHTGPNPGWVEVTHLPTMQSVRAYDEMQYKARDKAMAALDLIVDDCRADKCSFPEQLSQPDTQRG